MVDYNINDDEEQRKKRGRGEELINFLNALKSGASTRTVNPIARTLSSNNPTEGPSNLSAFQKQLQTIGSWGDYSVKPKQAVSPIAVGRRITGGGSGFDKFIRAIKAQESGGRYSAINRSSGALGAYQVMPGNVPSWAREILGHSISAQEFLRKPKLQDRIAQAKLQSYFRRYGARGAAEAWYGGPGSIGRGYVRGYSDSILRRMGLL
jgi:transglycosylase-like protein with SLT domain